MSATCNCPPDPNGFDCEHPQWVDHQCDIGQTTTCISCGTPLPVVVRGDFGIYCAKCQMLQGKPVDTEIRSVSATGGEKGTKVFRYDLVPGWPLRMLAKLYGVGARKYSERNWEKGYEWSKSFAALNRHLWAWWGGEDRDPETDIPHITCVAWHAFALSEFSVTHPEFDDRPRRSE